MHRPSATSRRMLRPMGPTGPAEDPETELRTELMTMPSVPRHVSAMDWIEIGRHGAVDLSDEDLESCHESTWRLSPSRPRPPERPPPPARSRPQASSPPPASSRPPAHSRPPERTGPRPLRATVGSLPLHSASEPRPLQLRAISPRREHQIHLPRLDGPEARRARPGSERAQRSDRWVVNAIALASAWGVVALLVLALLVAVYARSEGLLVPLSPGP